MPDLDAAAGDAGERSPHVLGTTVVLTQLQVDRAVVA